MKELVSDGLWAIAEPLLPKRRVSKKGGRPRVPDRAVLTGIICVLRTGIPWEIMPREMGCGSGVTCWRRLREWQRRGVWKKLHRAMLERLADADQVDWSLVVVVDARGIPLAIEVTVVNLHDSQMLEPMLDAIPPLGTWRRGRPRRWPEKLHADRAYDFRRCRDACQRRHIKPRIARRGIESKEKLGRHRWVVERTIAWLAPFRRLTIRYERLVAMHRAFLHVGSALICLNYLERF